MNFFRLFDATYFDQFERTPFARITAPIDLFHVEPDPAVRSIQFRRLFVGLSEHAFEFAVFDIPLTNQIFQLFVKCLTLRF